MADHPLRPATDHRLGEPFPGFFLCGIGISFIGPLFFGYASARSDKPGGVAVAELGALNQILTFIGRGVISVVAGATTLPLAMTIPGVM